MTVNILKGPTPDLPLPDLAILPLNVQKSQLSWKSPIRCARWNQRSAHLRTFSCFPRVSSWGKVLMVRFPVAFLYFVPLQSTLHYLSPLATEGSSAMLHSAFWEVVSNIPQCPDLTCMMKYPQRNDTLLWDSLVLLKCRWDPNVKVISAPNGEMFCPW